MSGPFAQSEPFSLPYLLILANLASVNVSLQYAQEHFADLISAADRGEEVEITRPDKPALRLVTSPETAIRRTGSRCDLLGRGEGLITIPTDEEWAAMDKEIEDEMVNGPIFPDEHP